MLSKNESIVIASAARTPTGNFNGFFKDTSTTELGSVAIQSAIEKAKISPKNIQQVYMGCVLPAGLGQAPARQAAIHANIPYSVGCTTINKMCGSGMKAVMLAYDAILADSHDIIVAGGMENMSRAPYLLPKARFGYRLGKGEVLDHMMLDGLEDAYDKERPMGYFAEKCATQYHFSREQQDEFARSSLQRAKNATEKGYFKSEIAPVKINTKEGEKIIDVDEGPLTLDPEKISKLRPVFVKDGTVTAANSSSISDGAASLILTKESIAKQKNIKPLAKIIGHYSHAQEPAWFTTAPISAIKGLLKKIDWDISSVDLFEINEAFAVVTLVAMKELKIPHEKINIHGGACVLGHPIGASGARILVTLLYAMEQQKAKRGIAALCIGGGEATAIAVEKI